MEDEEAKGGNTHGRWRVEGDGEAREGKSGRWKGERERESEKEGKITWTSMGEEIMT